MKDREMKRKLTVGLLMVGFLAGSALAQDDPVVNKLFSNHLVLQRDRPVPVWGTAKPGTKITVKFGQQEKAGETDKDGKWLVRLDALKTSAELAELTVMSLTVVKPVIITDVLVGYVWLCSGQSNMEWGMKQFKTEEDVAKADFPKIRQTKFGDGWVVCSQQSAGDFSATSFYFGRRIFQETGIPIGLLYDAVGATKIESWIPPEGANASLAAISTTRMACRPRRSGQRTDENKYCTHESNETDDSGAGEPCAQCCESCR